MMMQRMFVSVAVLVGLVSIGNAVEPPRQFYGKWEQLPDCYRCTYYCKPQQTTGCNYVIHYCYWWPDDPYRRKWMYMQNPSNGNWWGRCPNPWNDEYVPGREQWCRMQPSGTWTEIILNFCPPIPGSGNNGP